MSEVIEMLLRARDYVYMALNDENQNWSTEDKYNLMLIKISGDLN